MTHTNHPPTHHLFLLTTMNSCLLSSPLSLSLFFLSFHLHPLHFSSPITLVLSTIVKHGPTQGQSNSFSTQCVLSWPHYVQQRHTVQSVSVPLATKAIHCVLIKWDAIISNLFTPCILSLLYCTYAYTESTLSEKGFYSPIQSYMLKYSYIYISIPISLSEFEKHINHTESFEMSVKWNHCHVFFTNFVNIVFGCFIVTSGLPSALLACLSD